MDIAAPNHLNARKKPRQARSAVTVDAIFEATIQVLLTEGIHRLTTTRVAERAGVSVGTMYQYFPHKQALLYALNERYLDRLAERVEATCSNLHGKSTAEMVLPWSQSTGMPRRSEATSHASCTVRRSSWTTRRLSKLSLCVWIERHRPC